MVWCGCGVGVGVGVGVVWCGVMLVWCGVVWCGVAHFEKFCEVEVAVGIFRINAQRCSVMTFSFHVPASSQSVQLHEAKLTTSECQ